MRHPYVPWRDLPGLLAGIDINLAPVDPTRAFNHAKSEIKFLEAAAVGVPTVAGWAAGFAEGVGVVKPFGGALPVCEIAGSLAQWEETLADLIADPERRRTLGERAQRAVLAGATSEVRADFIVKTFADLAALRRADTGTGPVTVPIRTSKEKAERALRRAEATAFRVWLRLRRHWRLLADEVGGGG
jgi:glycosyltransferase involved in cell wall biosynthesis